MRRGLILLFVLLALAQPVLAADVLESEAQIVGVEQLYDGLNPDAEALLDGASPVRGGDFGSRLWKLLRDVLSSLTGSGKAALAWAGGLLAVCLLCGFCGNLELGLSRDAVRTAGALGIVLLSAGSFRGMLGLADRVIDEISSFSSLLLPVLSSVLTASGGVASGTALYVGSSLFMDVLIRLIRNILVPLVYGFLALAAAECACGEGRLSSVRELIGWVIRAALRAVMYLFTAYLTLTGLITGGADAAALRAAKAALSGAIPVVGGIVSDASESVLAGAALLKSSAGAFGLLAVLAVGLAPFLRIALSYLAAKLAAAVSGVYGEEAHCKLLSQVAAAMGYLLAMTGSCLLLALVSCCCFIKVVGT